MATTAGTINTVTVTALTFITDALEDLRVVLDGASPTAGDITKGMRKLNFALKKWAIKGWYLWVRDWIQVPMMTNQFKYTIGPGGDVDTYRPLRVFPGSFIRQTCGVQSPNAVPVTILSRIEYDYMSQKGALGVPNSIYYDPQMAPSALQAYDPALGKGVLYTWTAPDDMTRTIFLDVQRPIQDVTDSAQTFDLPLEWYEALTKNLAADMADAFEVPENRITRIKTEARAALMEISDWGAMEQ